MNSSVGGVVAADGEKAPPHHPAVEKARRDRINNLLGEIRELIPARAEQLTNGVDKRPKHVVLQDAIECLRFLLQERGEVSEERSGDDGRSRAGGGGKETVTGSGSPSGDTSKPLSNSDRTYGST